MEKTVEKFKALSDETRFRIINLFIKSDRNLCVCELMDALQIPQYAISKALTVLRSADFFTTEKEGTWVYYQLNKDNPENKSLFNFLENYLSHEIFSEDEKRLNDRLMLRENDRCVVGIIPESDLLKMIKEKTRYKMMNQTNSQKEQTSKKVDELLDEFDFLCKEEKRDFLMKIWESNCNEMMDDIFTKELMMKMCNDMMKGGAMPAFMERFFKDKKGDM